MNELDLLNTIRPFWINRVVQTMARGASVRDDLRVQAEQFFSRLEEAIKTGDPEWLDPILTEWSLALTLTDLQGSASSLLKFMTSLQQVSLEICREVLDESQALSLIMALMPVFFYALEKSAQFEMDAKVNHLNTRLEQTRQNLEKLDKSKSDFIAVAAHELKTPLTLVEGYTAMLREMLERPNEIVSNIAMVDGITNGAQRLRAIIDDMIDVSLIDNRLLGLNMQPVWINRLLQLLKNEQKLALKERNQNLILRDFSGSNEMTFGDPERLLQVFRNVLVNAIKFTPDNGTIIIDGRKLPGFIEVSVSDEGIGIDQQDLLIIFEKFSRLGNISLHSSGKTKFKGGGPGLGLHIAKGIIEAHGGAIWVESNGYDEQACPGSTFHILVPLHLEPPDAKTARLFASLLNPSTKTET
ncbi:MAG: HAMP domain-containing sensor histidine kinase [Chloroflexota bacterium]|jgi:signal transduction histidine kinase